MKSVTKHTLPPTCRRGIVAVIVPLAIAVGAVVTTAPASAGTNCYSESHTMVVKSGYVYFTDKVHCNVAQIIEWGIEPSGDPAGHVIVHNAVAAGGTVTRTVR